MQTHTRLEVDFFSEAREQFGQAIAWLNSPNCPKAHSELERQLLDRGMELLRALLQGQLNRLSDRERQQVPSRTPEPGVQVRTRARDIESDFGRVTLGRLGYTRKGRDAEFPLDRELNLPEELYSLQVRQRVGIESQRGCWDDAVSTVQRYSGAHVPKRQAQQLAARAAQDFDAFYEAMGKAENDALTPKAIEVASCDGKGVTMLKQGLRDDTRKAAEQAKEGAVRGDPMAVKKLRKHDKRMAIVTANWEQERQPRTAEQILANLDRRPDEKKTSGPRPHNKRVRASVHKSQAEGIAEMFDEIERRDPAAERTTVVLIDGELNQLEQVKTQALARRRTISIVIDLIHVIHYLWIAGYALCGKNSNTTETWVRERLRQLLTGPVCTLAGTIRRQATMLKMSAQDREPVDKCCGYLLKNAPFLRYDQFLAQGFPIATGVIEGACRHLVQDRMGITGARWDVGGAEAILQLRAVRCSGDWDDSWRFHEQREFQRNHCRVAA